MSAGGTTVQSGPWMSGVDSWSDTTLVNDGAFRWATNIVSRGGLPRTRPGFSCIPVSTIGQPRGIEVFTDGRGITYIVIAIGSQILYLTSPFKGAFAVIPGLSFATTGPVIFKAAIQNVTEASDGTLTVINPTPVLMMSDGATRTAYWDGTTGRHLDSNSGETPILKWMEFTGNRLWGSNGSNLRASNLANPLKFTEENILAEGGALGLPAPITGLGQTPDFKNLLIFTDQTTSSVQSNILDRAQWQLTPGFQQVVLPNIGCAAGKSITTQYGITWWFSHGGLIGLDQAIQTYRTSRIHFEDQAMNWSKSNLSPDITGIAIGTFENYLTVSVPSGDKWNAHTWVMDQSWAREEAISDVYAAIRAPTWNGIWTGIRPVEWATATVNGINRCFCLSQDYPPTIGAPPVALSRTNWTASANADHGGTEPALQAIDGNGSLTRWSTGTAQSSGTTHTFTLDMGSVQTFGRIVADCGADFPRNWALYVSNDGSSWGSPIASGSGSTLNPFVIVVSPTTARYLQIRQTAASGVDLWWSIYDLNVYDAAPVAGNNVWECFTKERLDVGLDGSGASIQKQIKCSLETKVLAMDANYKDFRYIEVDCENIEGVVEVTISYAPLRGGYKQVATKQIVASQWNVVSAGGPGSGGGGQPTLTSPVTTIAVDTFIFNSYRPQSRIIRTVSEQSAVADDDYCGIESNYPRQTDHGFSVLVKWTGQMSVRAIRLTTDSAVQESEGHCESDETTNRFVQMSGAQTLGSSSELPVMFHDGLNLTSAFVGSNTRAWIEDGYSSMRADDD